MRFRHHLLGPRLLTTNNQQPTTTGFTDSTQRNAASATVVTVSKLMMTAGAEKTQLYRQLDEIWSELWSLPSMRASR
jgi:hypothetical protein